MSSRYAFSAVCPDCGLTIACNGEGKFRAHNRQLADEGLTSSACYITPTREQEKRDAAAFRKASGPARREYWAARESVTSSLPKHLQ